MPSLLKMTLIGRRKNMYNGTIYIECTKYVSLLDCINTVYSIVKNCLKQ